MPADMPNPERDAGERGQIVAWLRNDVAFEASRMVLASGLPGGTKHARTKTRAFAEGCLHATSSIIAAIERGDHLAQRGKDAL